MLACLGIFTLWLGWELELMGRALVALLAVAEWLPWKCDATSGLVSHCNGKSWYSR